MMEQDYTSSETALHISCNTSKIAKKDFALADSPLVLVAGAEGAGLSRLVRQTCDTVVSIPISRTVESLNAAVAAGIGLYEVDRLRRRARPGRD